MGKKKNYKCSTCLHFMICKTLYKEVEKVAGSRADSLTLTQAKYEIADNFTCSDYAYKYIEYPLYVKDLVDMFTFTNNQMKLVAVRPASEDKTYLGIHLGDLPIQSYISYNKDSSNLELSNISNPTIFIPSKGEIVYGSGSWWYEIENKESLSEITDEEINNQWYVKLAEEVLNEG